MIKALRHIVLCLVLLNVSAVFAQEAPTTAVVMVPIEFSGTDQGKDITSGIATTLAVDLSSIPGISVIPSARTVEFLASEKIEAGYFSSEARKKMIEGLHARYLLSGSFLAVGPKYRLDLQLIDLRTGDVRFLDKAQGSEEQFMDVLAELSGKLTTWFGGVSPVKGGDLELLTKPEGAQVFLEEELLGDTPLRRKGMKAGEYRLRIELGGYQPLEETVVVKDREKTSRNWTLKRANGGIRVWWKTKVDSEVRLGSERIMIPRDARYSRNLPAGEYEVETRIPFTDESKWENNKSWKTYTATVTVEPDQVVDVLIDNSLFDPGIKVSRCTECENGWDWGTQLVWYEK
ncbi:MAG: PEGA domain-containing protein [Nitrospirota bacterium]|nr:PEGA domain-containing protein [Nitrospirota bacterium]